MDAKRKQTEEILRLNLQDMILFVQVSPTWTDQDSKQDILATLRAKLLEYTDMSVRN